MKLLAFPFLVAGSALIPVAIVDAFVVAGATAVLLKEVERTNRESVDDPS